MIAKTARRVAVALTISIGVGFLILVPWKNHVAASPSALFLRTIILGLSGTAAFALFEVWPGKLPRWLQRWALQVVAVGILMPVTTMLIYLLSTSPGAPPFWAERPRLNGWLILTYAGLLVAPWTALAAIVRQKEAFARDQKLAFALEVQWGQSWYMGIRCRIREQPLISPQAKTDPLCLPNTFDAQNPKEHALRKGLGTLRRKVWKTPYYDAPKGRRPVKPRSHCSVSEHVRGRPGDLETAWAPKDALARHNAQIAFSFFSLGGE